MIAGQVTQQAIAAAGDHILLIQPGEHRFPPGEIAVGRPEAVRLQPSGQLLFGPRLVAAVARRRERLGRG